MKHRYLAVILSAILAPAVQAAADETTAEDSSSLMEILVTASRMQQPARLPAHYRVIDTGEIRASGARSVGDVLHSEAGIQSQDQFGDGSRTAISLRGFGENAHGNTLILLNGRRLNNALDIAPAQLTAIPLDEVERIEIVQGSAGVLYGENAVGGVVNIVTRAIRHDLVELTAETGSYDRESLGARYHKDLGGGLRIRLHARYLDTDNYRMRNRLRDDQFGGGAEYQRDGHRLFAEWNRQDEDLLAPGTLFADQKQDDRRRADTGFSFIDTNADHLRGGWHFALGTHADAEIETTWQDDDAGGVLSSFGTPCPFTQARRQWAVTPRVAWRPGTDQGAALVVAGWDHQEAEYEIRTSCIGDQFADQDKDAVYLQVQWPLHEQLDLVAGVRRVWADTTLRDTSVFGPGFATFPNGITFGDAQTLHDIGLEYRPQTATRIFLRRAENFRLARVEEHTGQGGLTTPLRPQTGISLESGFDTDQDWGRLAFSAYHLALKDEIAFDPTFFRNRNLEPTERIGWQLDFRRAVFEHTRLRFSFAYVNARFEGGANAGQRIPFVAHRNTVLGLDHRFAAALSGGLEFRRISDRNPTGDAANTFPEIKGHERLDLYAGWRQKNWDVGVRLNNALNEHYDGFGVLGFNPANGFAQETAYYPAPERNFSLKWTLRL